MGTQRDGDTKGHGDMKGRGQKGWGHEGPWRFTGTSMGTWNNCRIGDTGTPRVGGTDAAGTGDMGTPMGTPVGLGTLGDGDTKGWGHKGMGTEVMGT